MAKAKAVGSFIGGIANNPGIIAIAAIGIGLYLFRDKISDFFQSLTEGFGKVDITLPEIKFPEFPEIEFPKFEDPLNLLDEFNKFLAGLGGTEPAAAQVGPLITETFGTIPESEPPIVIGDFNPFQTIGTETDIIVPKGDELGLGGGPSFISGVTTFGDNLVDSLTEVLSIFPSLTASQARDVLEEYPDLTGSQFRLIDPDVINITGEEQIYNVSSGGFTGLTPEQIAKLLTGGNISNF